MNEHASCIILSGHSIIQWQDIGHIETGADIYFFDHSGRKITEWSMRGLSKDSDLIQRAALRRKIMAALEKAAYPRRSVKLKITGRGQVRVQFLEGELMNVNEVQEDVVKEFMTETGFTDTSIHCGIEQNTSTGYAYKRPSDMLRQFSTWLAERNIR